ncbi:hypothetical protein JSO59_010125 [Riemerella anatipestifer]|uniref:hypothetical protein n=1 Tax=Riemerella anatipestifer TaxID=34085 RepID=UPI0030C04265
MRQIKDLKIKESIEKQKLIFKESWLDVADRITIFFFFSWGAILPFLIFFDPYKNSTEGGFEYYLPFLATFFCIYVIYRKATEKKLSEIETKNSQEENRKIITEYFEKNNFERYRNASNILIYNEENDFAINPRYQTSRIILLDKNKVYSTVLKENFRLNIPVLTKHIFLSKDLKKILK